MKRTSDFRRLCGTGSSRRGYWRLAATLTVVAGTLPNTSHAAIFASDIAAGVGGFVINGPLSSDVGAALGVSVSAAGDVNGDGLSDVIVGAPNGRLDAHPATDGFACVVFGRTQTSAVDPTALGTGGILIVGSAPDSKVGYSVSAAGDVNGDGLADVVVGVPGSADANGQIYAGRAYVIHGRSSSVPVQLSDVANGTGGFAVLGQGRLNFAGAVVAGVGDLDGDGLDEIVVSSPGFEEGRSAHLGSVHVLFGRTSTTPIALTGVAGGDSIGFPLYGNKPTAEFGENAAGTGDFDGDGVDDFFVGPNVRNGHFFSDSSAVLTSALDANIPGGIRAGDSELAAIGRLVQYDSSSTIASRRGLQSGAAGVGDVNGDGRADLCLSDEQGTPVVVHGRSTAGSLYLKEAAAGTGGFVLILRSGLYSWASWDNTPAGVGDMNGDGLSDLFAGFVSQSYYNPVPSQAFVVFGRTATTGIELSGLESQGGGLSVVAEGPEEFFGASSCAAGDVNGDGLADVIVGAPGHDAAGQDSGRAYVIFSPFVPPLSATYRAFLPPGDNTPQGLGVTRFGHGPTILPDSRVWLDFDGGHGPGGSDSASLATVTLARTDAGLPGLDPASTADVQWAVATDRTNWSMCRISVRYTDAEIAGLDEGSLTLMAAEWPAGPFMPMLVPTADTSRNQLSGVVLSLPAVVAIIGTPPQ